MSEPHKVHRYARLDRPYESVRACLHRSLVAGNTPTRLNIRSLHDQHDVAGLPTLTRAILALEEPTERGGTRLDSAEIYASAVSPTETQIEVECHCRPSLDDASGTETPGSAETRIEQVLQGVLDRIRRAADTRGPHGDAE